MRATWRTNFTVQGGDLRVLGSTKEASMYGERP